MIHHITRLKLPYEGITIFAFGDLQWGVAGFNREAWEQFKTEAKSTPNAYFLGLGDYEDFLRPSMRGKLYGALGSDDSARQQVDDRVRKMQDDLLDLMQFMEGKCIGLHSGHHEYDFMDRSNSTQRIASALKAPYLGWQASTRLALQYAKKNTSSFTYTIMSCHGNANGRKVGGSVNWMENNITSGWDANHYIMGHSCKNANWTPLERRKIRVAGQPGFDRLLPRCLQVGGFHEGYTNGWESSYVERNGFLPQPMGWGVIRLKRAQVTRAKEAETGKKHLTNYLAVEQLNRHPEL